MTCHLSGRGQRLCSGLLGLALLASFGCGVPAGSPQLEMPAEAIQIVPPEQRLELRVRLQRGSFVRSKSNPDAMLRELRRALERAEVFQAIREGSAPAPEEAGQTPEWRVIVNASDYGEPNAYTFDLQVLLVRGDEPVAAYQSKQSARQARGQLTIGPAELAALAERAIRDVVRQIAGDTDRLSALLAE